MTREELENFVDDMIASLPTDRLMVDPPSGWMYGFPKPYFKREIKDTAELNEWLVREGYPQSEIDSLGEHMHVRCWMEKV